LVRSQVLYPTELQPLKAEILALSEVLILVSLPSFRRVGHQADRHTDGHQRKRPA